jgi:hypothetical protein
MQKKKGKERRFILTLATKAVVNANPFTLLHKTLDSSLGIEPVFRIDKAHAVSSTL